MSRAHVHLAAALATAALLAALPHAARAQSKVGWHGETDASASLFFGNTRQWLVAGHSQLAFTDTALEVHGELRTNYAETAVDSGGTIVSARAWFLTVGADLHPLHRWSPFVLATVESSLQQRIDRRYSAGAGAKYLVSRKDGTGVSISAGLLWERTQPLVDSTSTLASDIVRGSLQLKLVQNLDQRLHLSHSTFYQPSIRKPSRFTIASTTTLGFDLTHTLALTVSLQDNYDSEARTRGARSNNDGQLLFGLRAAY